MLYQDRLASNSQQLAVTVFLLRLSQIEPSKKRWENLSNISCETENKFVPFRLKKRTRNKSNLVKYGFLTHPEGQYLP